MRWKINFWRNAMKKLYSDEWRPWFAWHPVQLTDDSWAWLTTVERRYDGETIDYCDVWEYR